MAISLQGKRRVVVQGHTYIYNAEFGYDQRFTDGGGVLIVREDRKVRITVSSSRREGCFVRIEAPELPWFAGYARTTVFALAITEELWLPGAVAKVVRWCLDPSATREVVANPWASPPAPLPDESTVEGFAARVLRAPERDLARVVDVAEEVLDRPLIARPLDPCARDLLRSRRLVQRVWETLATRQVIPEAWADGAMRFVSSPERALPGETERASDARAVLRVPPSLRCVLALASDVAGVLRAEALARESTARFESLCVRDFTGESSVLWRVARDRYARPEVDPRGDATAAERVADALRSALLDAGLGYEDIVSGERAPGWSQGPARLLDFALSDRNLARCWRLACERSLCLMAHSGIALDRVGLRFDALADPYAPLLELWRSGYALEDWSPAGALLAAPDVPFE